MNITELIDAGWDSAPTTVCEPALGPQLTMLVDALVAVGVELRSGRAVSVAYVAETLYPEGPTARLIVGARRTAARLQMPLWQVRRLMYVVLGAPN